MTLAVKRTLIILVGVVLAAVMLVLGVWQMKTARMHGKAEIESRANLPAVALASESPTGTNVDALYGRQVTLTGSYLPQEQVYVGTNYPLRVVTAFRTTDGRVIAVARGSVASPSTKVTAPPTGQINQTGLMLPSESAETAPAQQTAAHSPTLASLRIPELVQTWPSPMINGFVSLGSSDASAQGLETATYTLPDGDESTRNAGYALQWWVFAGVAVVGSVVIARSQRPGKLTR